MNNWKHPFSDSGITKYIDCLWYLEKTSEDKLHSHPELNPHPEAHFILAPPEQPYHYTINAVELKGVGCHLLLPSTRTIAVHHPEPFLIVGIKFKVGALYSLAQGVGIPTLDGVIGIKDLSSFLTLPPPVPFEAVQPAIKQALINEIEGWIQLLLQNSYEDKYSRLASNATALLGSTGIKQLSQNLHCSRRTLERAFHRVTGLTLKQYETMQTLEKLLLYLHKDSSPDWADVAAKFGFSDQPHLIRYLKTAINSTPGTYLKQRNLTIDVYGDFE